MEFNKLVESRHSIRSYSSKKVSEELLRKMLSLAKKAPSAGNLQSYEVVVVKEKKKRKRLARACLGQSFVGEAPVVLVICADVKKCSQKYGCRATLYAVQDATIFASYLQLVLTDNNLSSCWVGAFNEEHVADIINSKQGLKPVCVMPLGFSNEEPRVTDRRELGEFVHDEELGKNF